ncbi:hypothetical protein B0H14DRAFT_3158258 [Mycena olivaceomarginata]|nr:hypothetical protein B0H14DRAFT_3158258 [Mycena olivaceomarginata]
MIGCLEFTSLAGHGWCGLLVRGEEFIGRSSEHYRCGLPKPRGDLVSIGQSGGSRQTGGEVPDESLLAYTSNLAIDPDSRGGFTAYPMLGPETPVRIALDGAAIPYTLGKKQTEICSRTEITGQRNAKHRKKAGRKNRSVPTAIGLFGGDVLLAGGTTTITSWGQGNIYTGSNGTGTFTQSYIATNKPAALLDSDGNIFGRTHPQYTHYAVNQFVSVRDQGAKGDGVTDDTAALQQIFAAFSGCKIVFFDAGTYIVTSTLTHSCGNPNGRRGLVSSGVLEITDIIFTTIGPAGGAIVVEWNVQQTTQGGAGMWDSHIRLGGAAGTNLQAADCPSDGSGVLKTHVQGTWVWLADHDLDEPEGGQDLVSIYSGRGILSESAASEHYVLYQYNLANAKSHYMGLIQTETTAAWWNAEGDIGQRVKGVTPFARVNLGRIA